MKRNHKKTFFCGGRTSAFDYQIEINTDSAYYSERKRLSFENFSQKYIDSSTIQNIPSQESLDICYIILKHKVPREQKDNLLILQKKLFAFFQGISLNSSKYMLPEMLFPWKRFRELGFRNEMFYPMKVLKNGLRIF